MTKQNRPAGESFPGRRTVSSLVLTAGFGLTGAGTVMLGVLLPTLTQEWGMRDNTAGFLLFLQFLGSSAGALLVGANRIRSLMTGYGLLVVSACTLAFAGRYLSFPIFFLFGLGLGTTMTTTSLLFSDRYGNDRAAVLERLNFAWSAGAMVGPMLFLPFLRTASLRSLFFTLDGLFLLLLVWVIFRERAEATCVDSILTASPVRGPAPLGSLLTLLVLAMCSVGVESALSGWLTTYSHRADPKGGGAAALATSIFWLGMVLSRLLFSTRLLAIVGRSRVLHATLWGVAASVGLLVVAHHPVPIRLAAGLAGLCMGPVYPLLLSFLLERSPHGWVFCVAGIGSALLPWLTGLLSAYYGSLRYGLIAPCGAALLMVVLFWMSLQHAPSSIASSR
jgi:FHS family glucose/mannose:H+ symporter-like MFS transporter